MILEPRFAIAKNRNKNSFIDAIKYYIETNDIFNLTEEELEVFNNTFEDIKNKINEIPLLEVDNRNPDFVYNKAKKLQNKDLKYDKVIMGVYIIKAALQELPFKKIFKDFTFLEKYIDEYISLIKKYISEFDILNEIADNYLIKAIMGYFHPVIGREKEIDRLINIINKKEKNNVLLAGKAGVGKTALVKGVMDRVIKELNKEDSEIKDIRIFDISVSTLVDIVSNKDAFNAVKEEIINSNKNVIFFIDEAHMMARDSQTRDLLKPLMLEEWFKIIGATTLEEKKIIEQDKAFNRRFVEIIVKEPSIEDTENILNNIKYIYEEYHGINPVNEDLIKYIVKLANNFITYRNFPDKAIDLLDESMVRARRENVKDLNEEIIARQVEEITGIEYAKITEDQEAKIRSLDSILKESLFNKDNIIDVVAKTIKRAYAGLKDPDKPIGVFLFLGPSGTGKTEFAKRLAEIIFGSKKKMTRIDMSEYMEAHSVARLYGAPPGYVGYNKGGQLTEAIKNNPYQVILLDEIEKAHPRVFDAFLQIFDDGRLTDGQGETISFKHSIIIMTSNIGSQYLTENIITKEQKLKIAKLLKTTFRPEFLNRIDAISIFKPFRKEDLHNIAIELIKEYSERLENINLQIDEDIINDLVEKNNIPEYGARPLKKAIEQLIINNISEFILQNYIKEGDIKLQKITDEEYEIIYVQDYNKSMKINTTGKKDVDSLASRIV